MKPPPDTKLNLSRSDKAIVMGVSIIIVIAVAATVVLIGILLRQIGEQRAEVIPTSVPTSANPSLAVPTVDCGSPSLVIGSTTFQIQTFTPGPDASLTVPPDTPGIAYWVEGTDNNYVFILSQTPENLSFVPALPAGSMAKVTWKNCNSTSYSLDVPGSGLMSVSALPDQSLDGITIFVQSDPSGNGILAKGELTEEQISTFNTPVSSASEIQAEIGVLETDSSPDGTMIEIKVSIYNWGQSAFTLSTSDVSLTRQDGTPLTLVSNEPSLPREIPAGLTETFYLTFPRPTSPVATLKIFTIEYDIEGY